MNAAKVLHALWREGKSKAFSWDCRDDCLGWAGRSAAGIVGVNPAASLFGLYSSRIGAHRLMVERGWETMGDVVSSMLVEIAPSQAKTGDWAIIKNSADGEELVGVFWGSLIAAKTKSGMGLVPRLRATRSFDLNRLAAA